MVARFWWLPLLLLLLGGGYLFWASTQRVEGEDQAAVCVVLIDRTTSTDDTHERLEGMALDAVDGCSKRRASMLVTYFTQDDAYVVAAERRMFDLVPRSAATQAAQDKEIEAQQNEAVAAIREVFAIPTGGSRNSNIVFAIGEAARDLQDIPGGDGLDRILLVFTDGYQTSVDVSFAEIQTEDFDLQILMDRSGELDLLPDLDGAEVHMYGVRSGEEAGGQFPQWFDRKVKSFWEGLVARGGGELCSYRLDAAAVAIPGRCS